MRSYLDGMLRYFEFSGRSNRMQFWMFYLFQVPLFAAALFADFWLGNLIHHSQITVADLPLTLFVSFVHIVPNVTVQVRRLHDIGKSGAWFLLNFVPLGSLVLLYWACRASDPGSNYEGPEVSSYQPQRAGKTSTIPPGVRMGATRTSAGSPQPTDGRFI